MAEAVAVAYEEQRRRQIEMNKRKLEELQLHHLSAAVREAAAAAKPSSAKKRKAPVPRDAATEPPRRSDRLANLPEKPMYREVRVNLPFPEGSKSNARVPLDAANSVVVEPLRWSDRLANLPKKPMYHEDSDEERSYAISKAEELVQELGSSFPIFTQPMTLSHVSGGFWLGLPKHFCREHLPKSDETITLVDEEDDESDTFYLAMQAGLSTGWKEFAIQHKLLDGDCLVFQLIERTKFKVIEIYFALQ
ncbi:B3 domain-containing protein [Zea mays]|uniref:B3 domain-containing protein n=1 Tax=Zea mays TaxID=4577 RepID=A0A1D6NL54_MAIZE|nr:B3 domain-containing protein [Zea mays]